ncbi:DUF4407 domain-containing protein [Winogradskyella sp. F6397]|uniref:DUF4407 domain-containing protein n=1 Tax=Winogradskyella marina TaxID=2785530 RepID=A0ABS0EFN5_9FLAO|nr:DUF4407 domain-containing protein [Winogradskyella marina]MBF8149264.1 DUF4407 domain-containing protein [Winogradskyella marina]
MLRLCSILIGEEYKYTNRFQPSSKRKILLLGTSMMIPVILWFLTAFLSSKNLMDNGLTISLITGFIAALIIYLIERSIVLSNGGWPIAIFRILLGFAIASMGAIALDLVIFKSDVDNKVNTFKGIYLDSIHNHLENKYHKDLEDKRNLLKTTFINYQNAEMNYKDEMQGKEGNSSGLAGNGSISNKLENIMDVAHATYLKQGNTVKVFESNKILKIEEALNEAESKFNPNGLLIRIKALNELVQEDSNLSKIYWLFTGLLFLMEFIVIIIKLVSRKSIDEEVELFRDEVTLTKLQQYRSILQGNNHSLENLPKIMKANKLLGGD